MRHRVNHVLAPLLLLVVDPGLVPTAVVQAAPRHAVAANELHQRLLPLQGGQNFRDLGGYRTRDGRHVKWGLLFRSGSMHGLTAADYAYLESRRIRVVCDFRDIHERTAQPVNWPTEHAPMILSDDYSMNNAGMMPKGPPATWTEKEAKTALTASYPRLLATFNGQYRRMFAELLKGHAPLAFNCSAGKDRTGIAAALILTALGVPRRTVVEDYTATNRYLNSGKILAQGSAPANMMGKPVNPKADPAAMLGQMKPGALHALMAADPSYIEAALAVMDRHPGGNAGYLRDELGLGRGEITKLRQMYLE